MKLLVTGATGLIGAALVEQALQDEAITELILLVRKDPALRHPKLRIILHQDYLELDSLRETIRQADALAWCLGTSQTQVGRKEYEKITVEYTAAFAAVCKALNPGIRFVFVSGDGADRTEKSSTLFRKLKGRAENILFSSGLENLVIVRPDAVRPRTKNKRAPLAYKLAYPFFPLLEWLAPHKVIWSDVLGRAILALVKEGAAGRIIENRELRDLGKKG
jgi:uncharacterized protein YbjT (DUF2867 family)